MYKVLLLILLLFLSQSRYTQNRKFNPPPGTFDMAYTSNQQRLIVIAQDPKAINIYDGFTAKSLQNITLPDQFVPQTLTLSPDSQYLAVGSNTGGVKIFSQQNGSTTEIKEFNFTQSSKVNGLAFSPDSELLAIGIGVGNILLWKWQTQNTPSITKDFGIELFSIVWSPSNALEFWVGGGVSNDDRLVVYELIVQNTTVTDFNLKTTLPSQGGQVISNLASTSNTQKNEGSVYRVGSNNIIYVYDADSLALSNITLDTFTGVSFSKIQVTKNEEFISTLTAGNVIGLTLSNDSTYTVDSYTTPVQTFAMSPSGGNIIILQNTQEADVWGQCVEGQFFDTVSKQCVTCTSNCNICFESANDCKECGARYYIDNQLCAKCSDGCRTCVDGNSCDSCRTQDGFEPDGNLCKCSDGTFDQNDACANCVTGCRVCDNAQTCQTCWDQRGFGPDGNVCSCKQKFYPFNNNCQACIKGCLNCTNGQSCNICDNVNHYIPGQNNTCVCDEADHFVDGGASCVCETGYYEQTNACVQCPRGCTECSSDSNCTACDPDKQIRDNVCKCPIGQYINEQDTCSQCSDAIDHCIECDTADTCLKCEENVDREVKDGKCPCVQKFFENNDTCVACGMNGCLECTSASVCTNCDAGENWEPNPDNQQCKCMVKYVQVNNLCESCPLGCNVCNQNKTCETCDSDAHFIDDGVGGCKCDSWYFLDNTTSTCEVCMAGCITCTDKSTCTACDENDNFFRNETTGECQCLVKYFLEERNCTLCENKIKRCLECRSQTVCTKCTFQFKLLNPSKCGCEDGKYVKGNLCDVCPEECETCQSEERCTACKDGYDLDEGTCKSDGLDTLVIVMIVVGVLAVAGAGFAIIKCIKKKRSPLEEEGYQTMDSPK